MVDILGDMLAGRSGSISDAYEGTETYDMLTGGSSARSSSGVSVNRTKALNIAEVWRAVNLISTDVARIPIEVVQKDGGGGKKMQPRHPAWSLLRTQAHLEYNSFVWKKTATAHVLLNGNHYSAIGYDGSGRPVELLILDPEHTWRERIGGELKYKTYMPESNTFHVFDRDRVLHLMNLGYDGRMGYSVLSLAADTLGFAIASRDFGAKFFSNGARPSMVIEHPSALKDTARQQLRESWERLYSGVNNAHKTAVLWEGATVKTIGQNAEESQLLESRQFSRVEIANWFGLPPHKLGDQSRTSYNSLEQENASYLNECLDGHLSAQEAEFNAKLLSTAEIRSGKTSIEYNRDALLRPDTQTRTNVQVVQANNGMLTLDEIRAQNNLPPLPNGEGAKFRIPTNLKAIGDPEPAPAAPQPPGMTPQQTPAQPTADDRAVALNELLAAEAERAVRRIGGQAKRHAKAGGARYWKWLNGDMDNHRAILLNAFRPIVRAAAGADGVDERAASVVDSIIGEMRTRLLDAAECNETELAHRVEVAADSAASVVAVRVVGEFNAAKAGVCNA